ncbi:hypothetical protein A2U01_0038506, partial [Trifolium medium]|nr:hypothetical protein [Trifolium medium]
RYGTVFNISMVGCFSSAPPPMSVQSVQFGSAKSGDDVALYGALYDENSGDPLTAVTAVKYQPQ